MACTSLKLCISELKRNGNKHSKCKYSKCMSSYDSRSAVVVAEKGKKYELINTNADKIASFHIDGGMIPEGDIMKCDNLLIDTDLNTAIFVELKGTDLRHALEQVERTIDRLLPGISDYQIFARVVTSGRTNVPNIKTCPQYITLNRKILKSKGNVYIHSNIISEDIANL